MKRRDLTVGGRYAGPADRCYEIFDLSPGWLIDHDGQWVQDTSTRRRYMPGRGDVAYRANHAVRAWLLIDNGMLGGDRKAVVIDPRKLTGPWEERERVLSSYETSRVRSTRLMTLMRRNLRGQPGYKPDSPTSYQTSEDGLLVTIPTNDLSYLLDVAFGPHDKKGSS